MRVEVIETAELGDRSYVVHDGQAAAVIDPQRDLDRLEKVLAELGVAVVLVLETHIHNDYVTGGYELARRTGARYAVNGADEVAFDRLPVRDGDCLEVGTLRIDVVHTPGHTDTHLAYVVTDTAAPQQPPAVFTGGSLLYGSVGRTDLVDPDRTVELTHAQYRSARRLAELLPDPTTVYPTHGFGSFCSSGSATGGQDSTIGTEKHRNDALITDDEQAFVETLVANLTAYPTYYAHMEPLNRRGPDVPDIVMPEPVDPAELSKRITGGEWVIDLRDRVAYASDHLSGTVSIALGTQFATYLGWVTPWGAPLTLLADTPDKIIDARRQLLRIGIDDLAGAAAGELSSLADGHERRSYRHVSFADAAAQTGRGDVILDVRRDDERASSRIDDSLHIPLSDLIERLDELPDATLWVHCASGFRASIGASILDRAGRRVVLIDDEFDNASSAGLPVS